MKITRCALAALCGCALLASPSWAQTLRHPASTRPAALSNDTADYGYRYYDSQEEASPSDAAAAPAAAAPVSPDPVAEVSNRCDSCGVSDSSCGCGDCDVLLAWVLTKLAVLGEPFKLFDSGDNAWESKSASGARSVTTPRRTERIILRTASTADELDGLSQPSPVAPTVDFVEKRRGHGRLRL